MKGIFDFKNRDLEHVNINGYGALIGFRRFADLVDALAALNGSPQVFFRPAGGEFRLSSVEEFEAAPKGANQFHRETSAGGVYELGWIEGR